MITLQRPDSKISAFLGEHKGVRHGDSVRPSLFTLALKLGTCKVIFNTLTQQCIESKYFEWFESREERLFDESDLEMTLLLKRDFIVAPDLDEAGRYARLIKTIRSIEKPKKGYVGYTILPTTACNARCAYCFEQGIAFESMTDEVVEQTIRYILATRREDANLHLHWFGGEPLMGEQVIDRICAALREADISYISDIVTNGSLMNEDLARKAKEEWHLTKAQITLDGREEKYCEIKRYVAFQGSPYRAVLNGIHALLDQNIRVSIRLNLGDDNLDELIALIDELEEEFTREDSISIYCHSIFADEEAEVQNEDRFYGGMAVLSERLYEFNKNRVKQCQRDDFDETEEKQEKIYDRRGSLKRYYCMVDSPDSGGVILPNGDICLCEHVGDAPIVSTVFNTVPLPRDKHVKDGREKDAKCNSCALLPDCSDQTNCPILNRDCYKEGLSVVTRNLRALEGEKRLPPITIYIGDRIIRVTEPTREFVDKYSNLLADDYLNADETVTEENAEIIMTEYDNKVETLEDRKKRLINWAAVEKMFEDENTVLDPPQYLVLKDKKLAYLVNGKAACSSIKASMIEQKTINNDSVHIQAEELGLIHTGLDKPDEYYVFTFVRNPFARMVSCYESKYHTDIRSGRKRRNDFKDYFNGYLREDNGFDVFVDKVCEIPLRLMDRHIRPQYDLIYDEYGHCKCDYIGKMENINEEFKAISTRYGLKPLPHYNASYSGDWREYYTLDSAKKIYERYKKDFETFGYEGSYEELLDYLKARA